MDKDKKVLASKACYDSNGGNANTCVLTFGKTTGTTFYLKIDSKHGTWNWMGQWQINDGCVQYSASETIVFSDTSSCKPRIVVEQDGQQHSSSVTHGGHKVRGKGKPSVDTVELSTESHTAMRTACYSDMTLLTPTCLTFCRRATKMPPRCLMAT